MNIVHFVDTCVMDNLLDVPGWNNDRTRIIEEYTRLSENGDTFVLPVAVLVETGNHIAQARYNKYEIADKFAKLIHGAIDGTNNWNVRPSITKTVLDNILSLYPSNAARSIGFGDTSIQEQFEEYWVEKQPIGEMRIWTLDDDLSSCPVRYGGLERRKNK